MDGDDPAREPSDASQTTATSSNSPAIVELDPELLEWTHYRVGEYVAAEILRSGKFYRRWNIRKLHYNVTQRLDYSPQSCLYLAASSGRGGWTSRGSGSSRAPSVVGFNRNPVDAMVARNARKSGDAAARPVWTLLAYVVVGKRQFGADAMRKLVARVTAIKGVEAKMLELLRFSVRTDSPLRLEASVFDASSRWHMPTVQKYMASHEHFIEYARTLSTPRRALQSGDLPPPARSILEPCGASPASGRDRPQTLESRPAPPPLRCLG